jgi:hypothetical protein
MTKQKHSSRSDKNDSDLLFCDIKWWHEYLTIISAPLSWSKNVYFYANGSDVLKTCVLGIFIKT